jgi:hypothetical protein
MSFGLWPLTMVASTPVRYPWRHIHCDTDIAAFNRSEPRGRVAICRKTAPAERYVLAYKRACLVFKVLGEN